VKWLTVLAFALGPALFVGGVFLGIALETREHQRKHHCLTRGAVIAPLHPGFDDAPNRIAY
jgi:hypothetical protein